MWRNSFPAPPVHPAVSVIAIAETEPFGWQRAARNRRMVDPDTDDQEDLRELIQAAREACEQYTGRSIVQKTLELGLPRFPCEPIELPQGPVRSVTSIAYTDADGNEQTLDPEVYAADLARGWVTLAVGSSWPATQGGNSAVRVRYVAGHDDADTETPLYPLPMGVVRAMLLLVGHYDENREASTPDSLTELPLGVQYLLNPYRIDLGV